MDCNCCCSEHHKFNQHTRGKLVKNPTSTIVDLMPVQEVFPNIYEQFLFEEDDYEYGHVQIKSNYVTEEDALYDAMTCLQTDFYLE